MCRSNSFVTISLIDVSLPGIVYRVLLSNQNMSSRLNIISDLLIYLHFKLCFHKLNLFYVYYVKY